MRTLLSRFSEDFVRSLDPLLGPLEQVAASYAAASEDLPGRDVLAALRETHHQLGVLVKKVADQHAFVLIFGPLKSGKSTLMNALAAAYVSEVTSLPAYPCMVHVSHSDGRGFTITRYDGETELVSDAAALHLVVQRAHAELAQAIRDVEERGEAFDPATHFPKAIRKIDVSMPAQALAQSGAELVDTPGLYSRMKFGYDRMTRDFRDVAACAIFVVKSDNLFLEQVFDEFNDLLGLFSRIFLVVNIDSTKRDLSPMGKLVPSLEQEDPLRIVEAFEQYAMSMPLKRAAEEGRLRIYPIDLLQAAAKRLSDAAGGGSGDDESAEAMIAGAYHGQASFQSFLDDLTQFLNSTDYLTAFIDDGLRRAEGLLDELGELTQRNSVRRLSVRLEELRRAREQAERCRVAVEQLSEFGWEVAFDDFEQKLHSLVRERLRLGSEKTADTIERAVDTWFQSDASFQDLMQHHLEPALANYQDEVTAFVQETLMREAAGVAGGIRVSTEIAEELRLADVRADELARKAIAGIQASASPVKIATPFKTSDVPVKKSFWDWCLFRSANAVRQRLFGPANRPTARLAKGDKAARLGGPAREAMRRAIDAYKADFFPAASGRVRKSVLNQYAAAMSKSLRGELASRHEQLVARLDALEKQIHEHAHVHEKLDKMAAALATAQERIEEARDQHGTFEDRILQPAPRPAPDDATADADAGADEEAEVRQGLPNERS